MDRLDWAISAPTTSGVLGLCCILTCSACLQLQTLMLQMAADAAAPAARPCGTTETSTSTLCAPDALLLKGLGMTDQQHQEGHVFDAAMQQEHAQQEQQQSHKGATPAAELPVDTAQSTALMDNASFSNSAERGEPAQTPSAAGQQAHHHDANQPWTSAWTQPMLPAVTVAAGQSGQRRTSLGQQRRRGTVDSVAVSTFQHRHNGGLHAVRSLSWSQSAEEHPVGSLPSSGKWSIATC